MKYSSRETIYITNDGKYNFKLSHMVDLEYVISIRAANTPYVWKELRRCKTKKQANKLLWGIASDERSVQKLWNEGDI